MDEILGALFAVLVGVMYLPQVTNAVTASRHTMTDVTTAQEQQQWASAVSNYVSQNMTTLETSATATSPVTLSVTTVQAANVGLPTNFAGTNPFNQTWTAQVLQPVAGTLQVLAFGSGGNVIKDQELGQIARAAAGAGGFIPTNNSGAYAGASANAYGTYGAWKISTAGYSIGSGGAPATLQVYSNGASSSDYLYRNAIPGQPQLNEMNTALGLNGNDVNDVGTLTANGTVTAGEAQINGISNLNGTVNITGNTTMANGTEIYNPGTQYIETGGGNLYLKPFNGSGETVVGGGGGSGQLEVTGNLNADQNLQVNGTAQINGTANIDGNLSSGGYVVANGAATVGTACSPGSIGNSAQGVVTCQSGVWSRGAQFGGTYSYIYPIGGPETDVLQCESGNSFTGGGCSCPSGYTGYAAVTGQGNHNSPWDTYFLTVLCFVS
jgi:Bacterial shufflon protein, N-terminal constant region